MAHAVGTVSTALTPLGHDDGRRAIISAVDS